MPRERERDHLLQLRFLLLTIVVVFSAWFVPPLLLDWRWSLERFFVVLLVFSVALIAWIAFRR